MKLLRLIVPVFGFFAVALPSARADVTLTNANAITLVDATNSHPGIALPFPATVTASGLTGTLTGISITLTGLTHTSPDDLGALFSGPGGQVTKLFDAPGDNTDAVNLTLTFDDSAAATLPDNGPLVSGTYRPGQSEFSSFYDAPAPPGPYASNFSAFTGLNPNGTYRLFIEDFSPGDSGVISGGFSVTLRGVSIAPAAVPEPAPAAFLSLGTLGLFSLAAVRRRRAL